jgi:hypothetical protein
MGAGVYSTLPIKILCNIVIIVGGGHDLVSKVKVKLVQESLWCLLLIIADV